jgi:hypothetical protein
MAFFRGPNIVTDGLVLALDAASKKSYSGTGTTWYDLTSNSLDATLNGGTTFSTDNYGTIIFDGVNDYGTIGSSTLTAINVLTFELWLNRTGIGTTTPPYDRIFQKDGGISGYPAWGWHIGESTPATPTFRSSFGPSAGESNNSISFIDSISLNEWNCLATTIDSNLLASNYFNGVPSNSGTLNNAPMTTQDVTRIAQGDGREFQGKISTVKIYNRALTADEIAQNYNALKSRFGL